MIALSPSRLSDMECPHRFAARYITKTYKEPASPEMQLGNEVHQFIAHYERHCIDHKVSRDADFYWGAFAKRENLGSWTDPHRAKELAKIYMRSESADIPVCASGDWAIVESQMAFDDHLVALRDEDAWFSERAAFRIICDFAYRNGNAIRIIDHKTGWAKPDPRQLEIAMALVPRAIPALQMGGVFHVEAEYNMLAGFKPETIRLPVKSLDETAADLMPILALMAEVNSWPEKYGDDYPAVPCKQCERCGVPTCTIRKDVMTSLQTIPEAPVFEIPQILTSEEQAQKCLTFITFLGPLEKKLKDILKVFVSNNGPVVSGGMEATFDNAESMTVEDMGQLIDLLVAYKVPPALILDALSMSKSELDKIIKKGNLEERRGMIMQSVTLNVSRRFYVRKNKGEPKKLAATA